MPKKPRPQPTPPSPIEDIGAAVSGAVRLVNELSWLPVLGQTGLGLSDWIFLRTLAEVPQLRAGRFAARMAITPQRAAQIVAGLRKAGLVRLTPHAADSRVKDIEMTAEGQAMLARLDAAVLALFAPIMGKKPRVLNLLRGFGQITAQADWAVEPEAPPDPD